MPGWTPGRKGISMAHRRLIAGVSVLSLAVGVTGVAMAQGGAAPSKTTIKSKQKLVVKVNRYIQDGLRWDKDTYTVKSGGTLHIVNGDGTEGPHTFTVVAEKDLPKTAAQVMTCKICTTLTKAHGADPNTDAPPKFPFLENGVGQDTAPSVDRAGDSGVTGEGKKGESIDLKVTAKKGKELYFVCIIHPWMQGKVAVG
jgi:plastocyanin